MFHLCHASDAGTLPAVIQKYVAAFAFAMASVDAEEVERVGARTWFAFYLLVLHDKLDVQNEYSTLKALGHDVAKCSTVYYWPKENRKADDSDKLGILHVKCVVSDGRWLFLSSANLTKYAFSLNMELGVLITGGDAPVKIERMFVRLVSDGVFAAVS